MSSAAIRAGQAVVEIGADPRKLFTGLDTLRKHIRNVGVSINNAGVGVVGLGVAASAPFVGALVKSSQFQDTMASVAAVTDAVGNDFAALKQKAMDLGATTSFTAQEVADGMQALGQGGFTVKETLTGIDGTLLLARAGMLDLGEATSITVAALRSFKMPTDQAGKVADVLAKGANASNASVQGLGEGLSITAGIAQETGVSLEELTATLGVLADRGAGASVAGTAMRRVIMGLTGEQKKLKALGVEVKDPKTGKLKPLIDILKDLNEKTKDLDSTEKIAKLVDIFDTFGGNAIVSLMGATDSLETLTESLENSEGAAKKAADIMENTLGGSFRMLDSAVEAISLEVGDALTPSIRAMMDTMAAAAGGIAMYARNNSETVIQLAKMAAGTVAAGGVLIAVGSTIRLTAFSLEGLSAAAKLALAPIGLLVSSGRMVIGSMVAVAAGVWSTVSAVIAYGANVVATATMSVAAAGGSAAAWAAAAAPILLVVGALGAVAVGLSYVASRAQEVPRAAAGGIEKMGQGFDKAAARATAAFTDIQATAVTAMAGINDAIAAGDLSLAMDILWQGFSAAWLRGTIEVMGYVDYFTERTQNAFGDMYASMVEGLMGGTNTIASLWQSFTGSIYDIWTGGVDKLVEYWNAITAPIKRVLDTIRSYFDGSMDYEAVAKAAKAANDNAKKERASRTQQRAGDRQKQAAEAVAGLSALSETARRQREAKAAPAMSIEEVAAVAAAKREEQKQQVAMEQMDRAGEAVGQESAKFSSAGTFAADAISGMGYSDTLSDRMVNAAERTARATEKIANAEFGT
jgi:TP901 family phage tail tape measure protein